MRFPCDHGEQAGKQTMQILKKQIRQNILLEGAYGGCSHCGIGFLARELRACP